MTARRSPTSQAERQAVFFRNTRRKCRQLGIVRAMGMPASKCRIKPTLTMPVKALTSAIPSNSNANKCAQRCTAMVFLRQLIAIPTAETRNKSGLPLAFTLNQATKISHKAIGICSVPQIRIFHALRQHHEDDGACQRKRCAGSRDHGQPASVLACNQQVVKSANGV